MTTALLVAGVGMVTALGSTTRETITALDRGERHMARTNLVDVRGDRIVGSFALPVRAELSGIARAGLLAFPAIAECMDFMQPAGGVVRTIHEGPAEDVARTIHEDSAEAPRSPGRAAVFLCAPLPRGSFAREYEPVLAPAFDDWPSVVEELAAEIEARGAHVPAALRFVLARGHAAGGIALQRAAALLEAGEAQEAFIVGLDAHGERATLERFSLAGVLKSRRSPSGFTPGEAAAVLCVRRAAEGAMGVRVAGIGVDEESETPSTARGLTSAISQSIASWGGAARSITTTAIDLNGERDRAKEWTFAATRTLWRDRATPVLLHPAGNLGDVGAASIPLLIGLLARGGMRPGPALAVASSRDGLRAGVVLDGEEEGRSVDVCLARPSG